MAKQIACPACGTAMREIVWGYGTIADVADAGDVVIGGCVVDVDPAGRAAALQCPACGTRADAEGTALELPEPPATSEHPFAVAFSNPLPSRGVVTMTDEAQPGSGRAEQGRQGADASPYVDEDFGSIASGGDWRDHVKPYASRKDELPERSTSAPERVEPYASREDQLPERAGAARDSVEPYASREDELPETAAAARERIDPYASREDQLPERAAEWRDRIDPYAPDGAAAAPDDDAAPGVAEPAGEEAVPGERVDEHALHTSRVSDAEEEGWPSRDDG